MSEKTIIKKEVKAMSDEVYIYAARLKNLCIDLRKDNIDDFRLRVQMNPNPKKADIITKIRLAIIRAMAVRAFERDAKSHNWSETEYSMYRKIALDEIREHCKNDLFERIVAKYYS